MEARSTGGIGVYKGVAVVALAWALLGTVAAATYYASNSASLAENAGLKARLEELRGNLTGVEGRYADLLGKVTLVSIYIDYGNGTVSSFKDVAVSSVHPTAMLTLMSVADVDFQIYASLGILITGINGVKQSLDEGKFWLYYVYKEGEGWTTPDPFVGADKYRPASGTSLSFNLTKSPF